MASESGIGTQAHGANPEKGSATGLHSAAGYNQSGRLPHAVTPGGHALDTTQPAFPVYHRKFANPAPLGLCAFALTTFILSLINVQARHMTINNIIIGSALAYGGLVQLLAGMWEFAAGNTFGATAFSSYGGFWISFAFTLIPWSGVVGTTGAYAEDAGQLHSGLSFYLFGWFIFTFIMTFATLRASVSLFSVFFFLTITFLLLAIAEITSNPSRALAVQKAGGAFGIITAFCAWYTAATGLLTPDNSYVVLPAGSLARRRD